MENLGTVVTDLQQRIIHVDDRYSEIVGRERSTILGQKALSFTYADDLIENRPALDQLSLNGPGFTIIKRYVHGDGSLIWVKNHVTRVTDGIGVPLLCATTQLIDRPFGSERLAKNHVIAKLLCQAFTTGREQLTPEVVWALAIEALLWFYRAEMEGQSINTDDLAARMSSAPSIMIRWVAFLQERNLVMNEQPGPLLTRTCVRITANGEQKIEGLLFKLTN